MQGVVMMTTNTAKALFFLALLSQQTLGILPTGGITLRYTPVTSTSGKSESITFLASQSSFGSWPTEANRKTPPTNISPSLTPIIANDLLCSTPSSSVPANSILIVPRGECTFHLKALNAQKAGASAIVIYNTLASRYSVNSTTSDIIYPVDKQDYDCDYGKDGVSSNAMSLPYGNNIEGNDSVMKSVGANFGKCSSSRALLTGKQDSNGNLEACCAWDLYVWLYSDSSITESVSIPSVFVTMEEGDEMISIVENSRESQMEVYARWQPKYNASAVIIWMLGVFVAWLASWLSAGEIRDKKRMLSFGRSRGRSPSQDGMLTGVDREVERQRDLEMPRDLSETAAAPANANQSTPAPQTSHAVGQQEDELELTVMHAGVFIIFASGALFILFFFQIYNVVKVMYAFGCSGALAQVIFRPLYAKLAYTLFPDKCVHMTMCNIRKFDIGPISYLDFFSSLSGYAVGLAWIIVAFTVLHPEQNAFFWITQDIMGACICITFLGIIKLNQLKVATVLLSVAFFYDIFFVFITPYLFKGESIMITVATSGGPPTADPTWCEKYPKDDGCQGGDPLPMLFTIPRIMDYQGGSSLLGLGDIVLPGLLLSFAARLDEAKSLIGLSRGGRGILNSSDSSPCLQDTQCGCFHGYFIPLTIAYAIGLIMANMAVYIFQFGQPALLYLVPLTLGTMSFLGWRRGELNDLWNGPRVLMAAERFGLHIAGPQADDEIAGGENEMTQVDDRRSIS